MQSPPRFNVLGVLVSATNYAEATNRVIEAANSGENFSASALAVHAVMESQSDPFLRSKLNDLDLATPDGQPVRWALEWLHGTRLSDRVYGPFLMLRICEAAAAEGLPVFLFGSTEAILAGLRSGLLLRFPRLKIAGTQASRFREVSSEEAENDAATIRASGARIVFCGLGCPRQEHWAHAMKPKLDLPIVAVGAAFALWAGERDMAPGWMQRGGLEWLFRLAQEPRRLAFRYFIYNPRYAFGVFRQKISPHFCQAPRTEVAPRYFG